MAQLDSTQFKIQTQTLFPTNGVGGITAVDLRTQMDNIADSAMFVAAGQTAAPTANDDDANTAGNGVFQVGHVWIDETNDQAYICLDNSTGSATWFDITQAGVGGGITGISFQEEGSAVVTADTFNVVGANATVTDVGGVATLTISTSGSASAPAVEDEALALGYTFVLADAGKYKRLSAAGPDFADVPSATFSAGDEIIVEQSGAGAITFSPGIDMNLNSLNGNLTTAGQYAVVKIKFIDAFTATISGDLV